MADYKNLRIAVIGAGMGGLGTALAFAQKGFKNIDVYETASNLGFVGAGIQMPPNVARILDKLGVLGAIEAEATEVKETSIRQGSTDSELGHVDLTHMRAKYGHPHILGHRSSLAGHLYKGCQQHDTIKFHFATALDHIVTFSPKVKFVVQPRGAEPHEVEADILLAADGIKSTVRKQMLRELNIDADVEETGQAAYRIMLTREQMAGDPEMLALLDSNKVVRWIGEKRHIIAYPISSNTIYNLSTTQPDVNFAAATNATYTTKGSKSSMLKVFHDFCPLVHRMLDLVPEGEVCEWKLRSHQPLDTWVHGNAALLGDSCHPTLPHLSQGAAMAIEDAAALAEVVSRVPDLSPETLNRVLKVYELLRKDRTATLVELAAMSGRSLHLGEGKAKEERDKQFAALKEGKGTVPDKWASPDVQDMIYSHNAIQYAAEKFEELYNSSEK